MDLKEYWEQFRDAWPNELPDRFTHYYFCDNEKDADELAVLVVKGVKRATASCAWVFEANNERLPCVGDLNIITDFHLQPKCVVKTIKVSVRAFRDVPDEFAQREGEGDGSLSYWRACHQAFFSRECESIGKAFADDMPVVLEEFEVVYP